MAKAKCLTLSYGTRIYPKRNKIIIYNFLIKTFEFRVIFLFLLYIILLHNFLFKNYWSI